MSDMQSFDLHAAILQQSADAIIFADPVGLIRLWNGAAERLFGIAAGDAIGKSLDIIIPERLRAPHWRGYNAAMQAGRTEHAGKPTLTKALHASGESIYVQMSFAVVVAPDGAMQGSVAIARSAPAPTPATPR